METEPTVEQTRAKAEAARAATPHIVHIAVYALVELWKLDPAAAYEIAGASRLSAELRRETDD